MECKVGDHVKVMRKEPDFIGSYFAANILVKSHRRYRRRYETIVEEGGSPLEENLTTRMIRPYPPAVEVEFAQGDLVDVLKDEGW